MVRLNPRDPATGLSRWARGWLTAGLFLAATPARADDYDPFEEATAAGVPSVAVQDPFDVDPPAATLPPPDALEQLLPQQGESASEDAARLFTLPPDGCGSPDEKPLDALTIDIQLPQGELPTNRAAACWDQLNAVSGPLAAVRYWPVRCYFWNATLMFHRPLYFEEINLERYGYGCGECIQPFVSAAHFFGTVPALPYCLAADPPRECQYTLGHYRPGSCPPWRNHGPPIDPIAGLAEGGVLTGLIFLVP